MEERWKGRIKLKRIAIIVIIVILIILALFSWFTFYGMRVGNFVITLERSEVKLSLCAAKDINGELSTRTDRLIYPGSNELSDVTYQDIPDNISFGDGNKSIPKQYLCYSFYVINSSNRSVDYNVDFVLVEDDGYMTSMLRVLMIEGEVGKEEGVIYALPEANEERREALAAELSKYTAYPTRDMADTDDIIFTMEGKDLKVKEEQKYTIVIWIEGCDPDCVGFKIESKLKAEIRITGF